jgi:hypothetical protein
MRGGTHTRLYSHAPPRILRESSHALHNRVSQAVEHPHTRVVPDLHLSIFNAQCPGSSIVA